MSEPRSRQELEERQAAGESFKYLFFWGHQPLPTGEIGAGCLSQWWPADFEVEEQHYRSAEHFMMAEKARLFDDPVRLAQILSCQHPAEAKKLGRQVVGFEQKIWERERFDIVVRAGQAKFGQNPALRSYLLATGSLVLVEASPRDRIWGIGLGKNSDKASDPSQWRGLNLLGFALMEVRARLSGAPAQLPPRLFELEAEVLED